MANTTAAPNVLVEPGFLFWAPLGTAEPSHTAAGSVFTDAWPVAWVPLGATEEGSTFSYEMNIEPVRVAELFDPVMYSVTEMSGSVAFSMADYTLNNVKRAMNGGAVSTVAGTGATLVSKYEPPEPSEITRCMIGWESTDATVRLIARRCLNAATVETAHRKAPDKALLPVQFSLERPAGAKSFSIYGAGTARLGA